MLDFGDSPTFCKDVKVFYQLLASEYIVPIDLFIIDPQLYFSYTYPIRKGIIKIQALSISIKVKSC